jgi:hypothetical protein
VVEQKGEQAERKSMSRHKLSEIHGTLLQTYFALPQPSGHSVLPLISYAANSQNTSDNL